MPLIESPQEIQSNPPYAVSGRTSYAGIKTPTANEISRPKIVKREWHLSLSPLSEQLNYLSYSCCCEVVLLSPRLNLPPPAAACLLCSARFVDSSYGTGTASQYGCGGIGNEVGLRSASLSVRLIVRETTAFLIAPGGGQLHDIPLRKNLVKDRWRTSPCRSGNRFNVCRTAVSMVCRL